MTYFLRSVQYDPSCTCHINDIDAGHHNGTVDIVDDNDDDIVDEDDDIIDENYEYIVDDDGFHFHTKVSHFLR